MAAFRIIRRLRDLLDFTLGTPSDGDRVTYDAATGGFVLEAASASGQPLDSDLTAIAALTTTSFGRALLELANQAALLSAAGAAAASHAHSGADITSGTVVDARIDAAIARDSEVTSAVAALSSVYQPLDSDLTAVAALTTTSYGRALLEAANLAALYTILAVDTDGTLTANSDAKLASQKAVKTYVTANAGASFATPAIVLGTAAAAGAASTVIRSDGTIAAFDATVPSTQVFGDAAAAGSAAFAARRDHKHAMPAATTDATIATTDVTTNDVSTSKHGWAPKAPNDSTKFLNGVGAYAVPAGGGDVSAHPVAVGRWWMPWGNMRNVAVTPAQAQVFYVRMPIPVTGTLTGIGVYVLGAGTAGALIRLGLYTDVGGVPTALILDAGTVATATTGFKTVTISQAATQGWCFFAAAWQGAPATHSSVAGIGNNAFIVPGLSAASPDGNTTGNCFYQNSVSGALPGTATPTEYDGAPNHFYLKY